MAHIVSSLYPVDYKLLIEEARLEVEAARATFNEVTDPDTMIVANTALSLAEQKLALLIMRARQERQAH